MDVFGSKPEGKRNAFLPDNGQKCLLEQSVKRFLRIGETRINGLDAVDDVAELGADDLIHLRPFLHDRTIDAALERFAE